MTRKTVNVGVISLGWMGRLHSRSYKRLNEFYPELKLDINLVHCADILPENHEYGKNVLGFQKVSSDYNDVLNDPDVDVVSICSPNYLHKEIALAAVKAGKPFWIEKPMGNTVAEAKEIAQAANEAGLATAVGFNYRHAPAVQRMRQLVNEGAIGRVTNVRMWMLADYAADPDGPLTWRYDPTMAGNGVVGDLLSHANDLVQYVAGRISRVSGMTDIFIKDRPIPTKMGVGHGGYEVSDERGEVKNEDYVAAIYQLANGAVGTVESSRVSVGPRSEYIIEVYGTKGSLRWNLEDLNVLEACLGEYEGPHIGYLKEWASPDFPDFINFQPGAGSLMGFDDLKVIECQLFLRSYLEGKQVAPSASDCWAAAEVDHAILLSASDGAWHDVPAVDGPTTYDLFS